MLEETDMADKPKTPVAPSRVGKINLSIWTTPDRRDALKIAAIKVRRPIQDIVEEAIDRELKRLMK